MTPRFLVRSLKVIFDCDGEGQKIDFRQGGGAH